MLTVRNLVVLAFLTYNHASASNVTLEEFPSDYLKYIQGNSLWTGIVKECKQPTMVCIQNQVFKYLKSTLDYPDDVEFTSFMKFAKNKVDYGQIKKSIDIDQENSTQDEYYEDSSPLEDMSRSLQDNTLKFIMTHNLELQLPETVFQGAILKLSPRSIEGNGALVKMEFLPPANYEDSLGEGRTIKKIKKFIGDKLLYALMAILMVIKLLAVKFLFIIPAVVGAAAAKKLIFKLLLFVFPALHHLFKWCAYVPHSTKFHHHKHHISHYHHVDGHGHGHGHGPEHGHIEVIAPHADGPPSLHHSFSSHDPPGPYKHYYNPEEDGLQYASQGPAFSGDYLTHRHDPNRSENEIYPWGQGQDNRRSKPDFNRPSTAKEIENMVLKAEKEALIKARLQQEKLKIHEENLRLQEQLNNAIKLQEKLRQQANGISKKIVPPAVSQNPKLKPPSIYLQTPATTNSVVNPLNNIKQGLWPPKPSIPGLTVTDKNRNTIADQVSITYSNPQQAIQTPGQGPLGITLEQQKQIAEVIARRNKEQLENQRKEVAALIAKEQQQKLEKQQNQFKAQVANYTVMAAKPQLNPYEQELLTAASITFDPFYSPILDKIDNILVGLGFREESCRERLICSMYKNPPKFSPHSNLLSAELSRDSKELQKPKNTNAAVIRFYKYVQAARDGQDKRDCIRLYPACAINTEE